MLAFLAAQHGRVVSKEELLAAVWNERIVTDDAVYRAVRLARNAFGENGTDILQTVHGRGYRCNAAVEPAPPGENGDRRTMPRLLFGASAAAALALVMVALWSTDGGDPSPATAVVAVSPFETADPDAQPRFLGTELAAEVIGDLARMRGLRVIGPDSSFTDAPPSELGIDSLVTGTLRRANGRLLVHAELHDVQRGRLIWSRNLSSPWSEIAELSGALASELAVALGAGAIESTSDRLAAPAVEDAATYTRFLEARHLWRMRDPAGLDRAAAMLERVISTAPDFARAHEALASVYMVMPSWQAIDQRPIRTLAFEAAREALRLEPRLGEARAILAHEARRRGDWTDAERLFRQALNDEPANSTLWQWFAEFLLLTGRLDEAAGSAERAVALDPVAPMPRTVLAWVEVIRGRDAAATNHARRAVRLGMPSSAIIAAWAAARTGESARTARLLASLLRPSAAIEMCRMTVLGGIDAAAAREAVLADVRADDLALIYHVVCLAIIGEPRHAPSLIRRAPESMAFAILWAPEFKAVRQSPAFATLRSALGLNGSR